MLHCDAIILIIIRTLNYIRCARHVGCWPSTRISRRLSFSLTYFS